MDLLPRVETRHVHAGTITRSSYTSSLSSSGSHLRSPRLAGPLSQQLCKFPSPPRSIDPLGRDAARTPGSPRLIGSRGARVLLPSFQHGSIGRANNHLAVHSPSDIFSAVFNSRNTPYCQSASEHASATRQTQHRSSIKNCLTYLDRHGTMCSSCAPSRRYLNLASKQH